MLSLTEWTHPLFPTFARTRWAASQQIIQWSAADVACDESRIGLAGSHTNVVRIFSPKDVSKKRVVFEHDLNKLAALIKTAFTEKQQVEEKKDAARYQFAEGKKGSYSGEIWVYAEQEDNELNTASYELLGKAVEMAGILGEKVGAVLVGNNVK